MPEYLKTYYWALLYLLLLVGCKKKEVSIHPQEQVSQICILKKGQVDYQLQEYMQILVDNTAGYSIEEITGPELQGKFQAYPEFTLPIKNYQYYWGKLQIENRLNYADQHTEWVLSFSNTWTSLDFFTKDKTGSWRQDQNGTFTPDKLKGFAPTARGNLVKLALPPGEVVTVYFRGISERAAIYPSFYTRIKHVETFYADLLNKKVGNAIFMGFLLMMFFYNLIVYFFGRDRSFIFYSGYLIMVVIYAANASEDLADWFGSMLFPNQPMYFSFMKLSLYLAMMCYLAFIRSFLDLQQLLPKWDFVFKIVIYLGIPLMVLDVLVLLYTNFSYVVEDRITVPYILLVIALCCALLYPLYKTKDKKGYFIIAGVMSIALGAVLTVVSRVWMPPFSLFYLKAGAVLEVLIFSLGLAYRQRQQKEAQQQADFKLKESQLIQERKQIEADRLKELNEFKARFYTNITHEFRTPLTVIMGMIDNIKNHEKEKTLIRRNSQNLLRLISQLLDLSKLESGSLRLNNVHQDIIAYLQYLTESFYSSATQKNIRLLFHSEEKQVMMDYDEEKIQQIVYNLLSNALKFTKDYGQVIFHASKVDQGGRPFLKLKVKDNGIGIASENIYYIFDRFYQAEQVGASEEAGTGIGLALTKELVDLMNGTIQVHSEIGEGSEFILYLPIEAKVEPMVSGRGERVVSPDVNQEYHASENSETLEDAAGENLDMLPELLIVEDNQDIIAYIKTIIDDSYRIHTAKNGVLGIEKALEIIPDIIISDVMMPEKNGYEVCETLKQNQRTSHIPIILLTAKATQSDKVDGLKYGADAYLTKPFDKEELIIRLKNLVETRLQLQQRYANGAVQTQIMEPSLDDIFLQKLREHIQVNLSDAAFGVPQLASAVNMSQMQVYRKLKALTGKTPSRFIRSYRLQQSRELLKKQELTISEIAYEVGFTDPSYFSRVFQQEYGKSPSDFQSV